MKTLAHAALSPLPQCAGASEFVYSDIGRTIEDKQERITDVRLQQMRELTSDKRAAESSEERKGQWHSLIAMLPDCLEDTRMPI